MPSQLFPTDLRERQWGQFIAAGFATPVSGVVFRGGNPPCCGVPLGGISTGCVDIDARGVYGWSTIFNPRTKQLSEEQSREMGGGNSWGTRKVPLVQPILGMAVGGKTWVLTTREMVSGGDIPWCTDPLLLEMQGKQAVPRRAPCVKLENVETVRDIHYWGHFPVADMEFETDAPISVGLRAWAPFIPGDVAASNTPAAVFEVHLRNTSAWKESGTLAMSFPGPDAEEARGVTSTRQEITEALRGMWVCSSGGVEYVLGVIGQHPARFGLGLHTTPKAWSEIASQLPQPLSFCAEGGIERYPTSEFRPSPASCSVAVDFQLEGGEEKVIRFLLAWFAPVWEGATKRFEGKELVRDGHVHIRWVGSPHAGDTHYFRQMYASRYGSALDVARRVAEDHEDLLQRILNWQASLYEAEALPVWLRDALVNNLCLIAEDSYWAQALPPLGDWVHPGGGFIMNECPRGCPQSSCIPCDWYGNHPIVYFFPELARQNLRLFKEYQRENGEVPFAIGNLGDFPEMGKPTYFWQVSLNGMCYIDMVDRLWQRTGDDHILREFYPSVKRCNTFTVNLRKGPGGPISMPTIGGMEWFEFGEWAGMATHMGGLRLAELRMVQRMAEAAGDAEYVEQCKAWLSEGTRAMEDDMWTGSHYLNFWEKETGKKSDDVMGYQLDGEWTAQYHGLPGVFRPDRIRTTLKTIRRCNIGLTPDCGAANFARPDGKPLPGDSPVARYGRLVMFPPEVMVLAMTYIYAGEKDFGIDFCRKLYQTIALEHGHAWDWPNIVSGDDGHRVFGTDYYQNMMLWALPAAIEERDIKSYCAPGNLVDRVIRAGQPMR